MKDTDYAFAVAKVRQLENGLLSKAQTDSLINAVSTDEILSFLSSKGWYTEHGAEEMLEYESRTAYETVNELLSGSEELQMFVLQNDFHNLKAAIKALASGISADAYYVEPTSLDLKTLSVKLAEQNYDDLPIFLRETAAAAMEKISASKDGQAVDILIDRKTVQTMLQKAQESGNELSKKYAELTAVVSDIKIAYRGAVSSKKYDFFDDALCGSMELNKEILARAATKGESEVLSTVADIDDEFAIALQISVSELEKVYEERVAKLMSDTALDAFGVNPVLAYYWKKMGEIKNIRIILTCKKMGVKPEKIAERVREINV